jgi:hypothetical protein
MEPSRTDRLDRARHRGLYALSVAVVVCAGLASRSEALALPAFAAKYAGDALWGLMIFLGLGLMLPRRGTAAVAVAAAVVCCAVEFSQLYRAPWLDTARRTWLGRMALGDTFGWGDIAAYLVGISAGGLVEWVVRRVRHGGPAEPSATADPAAFVDSDP